MVHFGELSAAFWQIDKTHHTWLSYGMNSINRNKSLFMLVQGVGIRTSQYGEMSRARKKEGKAIAISIQIQSKILLSLF
jgi:hypothetical protein